METKYTEINFTDEQRTELIRLMLGLNFVETKAKFNMRFWSSSTSPGSQANECGTSACAWGHAPLFCNQPPEGHEDWDGYMLRLLGKDIDGEKYSFGCHGYRKFIFSSDWRNRWQDAVARMYIVLTKGVPKHWDYGITYRKPHDLTIENYALKYGITVDEVYDRACELTV